VSISAVDTGPELIASMEWAYEGYWGLAARPFDNVPDPRFYVPSAQHEAAKQRILYGIHRRKGIVMLTGEIGSGKTLMSRALILTLPDSRYDVALVANPSMPEEEFLGEILFQFGAASGGSKAEQLRRLNDRLLANHQSGLDTILVVDEAQAIRHDTVFEGLRLLSNFQLNDRVLLTLVLLGQPELRARITQIPQLAQRVAIQAHLRRFTRAETKAYVEGRLALAGCTRGIFSSGALALIYAETGGVCRLINALCDACLYAGRRAHAPRIGRRLVSRVSAELLVRHERREGIE
jgi:general secretion pathway protein A